MVLGKISNQVLADVAAPYNSFVYVIRWNVLNVSAFIPDVPKVSD